MSTPLPAWAELEQQQSAELDRETHNNFCTGRRDCEILATDYDDPRNPDSILNRIPDRRDDGPEWHARRRETARRFGHDLPVVYLGLTAWTAMPGVVAAYDPAKGACPGCGDRQPRRGRLCLVCHADHGDPRRWRMQAPLKARVGKARTRRERRAKELAQAG